MPPLYEFRCTACGEAVELLYNKPEPVPPEFCDHCTSRGTMTHQISGAGGFRLKGSDWYKKTSTMD